MIKIKIKILIRDPIINESGHLSTFLEGQNHVFEYSTFQYNMFEFDSIILIQSVLKNIIKNVKHIFIVKN
jgi:hypothetical protein